MRSPLFLRIIYIENMWIRNMSRRPAYRTPSTTSAGNPNPELLRKVRSSWTDFSEGSGRFQCIAVARSTGARCRCNAVRHARTCKVHGGMRNLAAKIAKEGPIVAKRSKPCRAVARQYDVACAFALDDPSDSGIQTPKIEKGPHGKPSLSARGRKLAALAARQLNGTLTI